MTTLIRTSFGIGDPKLREPRRRANRRAMERAIVLAPLTHVKGALTKAREAMMTVVGSMLDAPCERRRHAATPFARATRGVGRVPERKNRARRPDLCTGWTLPTSRGCAGSRGIGFFAGAAVSSPGARPSVIDVADLYSVRHREAGPLATFTTYEAAELELEDLLHEEPTWVAELWIEPFELVTVDEAERF